MSESTKTNLSRRDFLRLAGLVGAGAALAACQPSTPVPETKPTEKPVEEKPPAEPVTISWWNQFSTPLCQELFPKVVKDFTDKNPNIKVEFEITGGPPGGGDYVEVLMARIAAGNPPEVITLWSPPSQFGARGALMAIDELMASASVAKSDAFFENPLNSCKFKGATYGLPASAGPGSIFFNKTLFAEAGLSVRREDFPKTLDELWTTAMKLNKKDADGIITQAGFVPWTQVWLRPVWSELVGAKLFSGKDLKYYVNSEENIALYEWYVKWLEEHFGGDIEAFNLISAWGDVYPDTAFNLGKSAIDLSGSWAPTDAAIPFDFEVAKFPYGLKGTKSMTGFWPNWFSMPKGVKNANEGFLFLEHMCTTGWVRWYEEGTMDTPAWKNAPAGIYTKAVETKFGTERAKDFHTFYFNYLNDAAEMWTSPIEDFASDTIGQAQDEILHKTKTVAEALTTAQELVQAKLDEQLQGS
jgi:multiple sugar transport system substrate-binding protein